MHVLRSICHNRSQKHMHLAYLTPYPKWVICLLPAKNKIYRYFTFVSVTLTSGCTLKYAILPIFVWRFHSNPPRALIPTPSWSSMHPKWSGTRITSKNRNISTLDLYNLFLAGYFLTIFWETFYIYINIIYPKFAPILRSQKKVDFSWSGLWKIELGYLLVLLLIPQLVLAYWGLYTAYSISAHNIL
jgi:hypothetical protein